MLVINADIIALNNNNDAKSFKPNELRENVIIVLDTNNTQETSKLAEDLTNKLERHDKNVIIIEPSNIPDGLNKTETTKQLVEEAISNITTKDQYTAKSISTLSSDIINTKEINENKIQEVNGLANNEKEHFQQLAIDAQRTPSHAPNIEQSKFDIGEKTR